MEKLKFSIIMPAFNAEKEIEDAIKSVLNQVYDNYEMIIIDDCSTDNTYEIIKKYESNKIKLIKHQENKKAGGARNTGIDLASGEYILFLDSDDLLYDENVLLNIVKTVGEERPDIVYLGFKSIGEAFQGEVIPNAENSIKENRLIMWNYDNVWDVLWRKDFLKENNIRFIEGKFFEDFVFYYEGVIKSKTYKYTDFLSFIYNSGRSDSMTTNISSQKISDFYYNLRYFAELIEKVDPRFKNIIVNSLKRQNNYMNRLLDHMK